MAARQFRVVNTRPGDREGKARFVWKSMWEGNILRSAVSLGGLGFHPSGVGDKMQYTWMLNLYDSCFVLESRLCGAVFAVRAAKEENAEHGGMGVFSEFHLRDCRFEGGATLRAGFNS